MKGLEKFLEKKCKFLHNIAEQILKELKFQGVDSLETLMDTPSDKIKEFSITKYQ